MSVEGRDGFSSSGGALSVAASAAAATGGVVGDSPSLYADSTTSINGSPESVGSASSLLRTVKKGVESEERRRGRGGKRDKTNGRFVNADKHLMKKGILELNDGGGSSTLPPSLSPNSRPQDTCRPLSFHFPTSNGPTDIHTGGVLVAGARGAMRVLRDQSPSDHAPCPAHPSNHAPSQSVQLAFSPDSGYGNTPDAMRHSEHHTHQTVHTTTGGHSMSSETGIGSSSHTERKAVTSTSDSTRTGKASNPVLFSVGDVSWDVSQSLPPVGSAVTTTLPSVITPPTHSHNTTTLPDSTSNKQRNSSSSLTVGGNTTRTSLAEISPRHYINPSSTEFPMSPGPTEQAQEFKFATPTSMTHGVSTPALSSLPTSPRYHGNHTPDGPRPPRYRRRDGDAPGNYRRQTSPNWRQRSRQMRARSQPMVASLTMSKAPVEPRGGVASGSGQKDYFQVTDELSRENSHFSLSEALLCVLEQYKANTTEALQETIREQQATPTTDYPEEAPYGGNDLYATSPPPRSWGSLSSIATTDSMDGFSLQKSAPKISLLELMRTTEGGRVQTAESTAQRLLQFIATQYSGVDAEDMGTSTTVLTLPVDFLSSLMQDEDLQKSVTTSTLPTRGNKDWAPPRAQIIFHIKSPPRSVMKYLAVQGYRCTGCGMRQDPAHARHFRFCHYTGKYFCQKCHTNASSNIPAHILHRWSFKKYYVSNFAHDLLERIHYDPVFDVHNINPQIYSTVPLLSHARDLRTQLVAVKKYLKTCRRAQSLTATFDGYIPWTADVHTYSIDDFLQIKLKLRYLRSLLQDSIKHVKSCPLCQGKGFVCEFCNSPEIVFPFELTKVSKCPHCQCCFHKECFNHQPCPRCIRMRQRERRRRAHYAEEEEDQQATETNST